MISEKDIETNIDNFIIELFSEALKKRASDIHIEAFEDYGKIRFRIDGVLFEYMRLRRENYEKLITKIKLSAKVDIAEKRRPQDANLKIDQFPDIDFRLSTINTVNGEKLVLRILSINEFKKNNNLLGFSKDSIEKIEQALTKKSGMIIFSGPTGSGKTTSLYSLLNKLNTGYENIITVEDPVEYKIEGINQVPINPKIGLTFDTALRSILRQDPDIIMIGEIRDKETAEIAIRAAITGHLVLTTVHTKDALSSIVRLKDLGVDDYLINASISLLASQRLVRKLCDCKKKGTLTDEEYEIIKNYKNIDRNQVVYRPNGCEKCKNGYHSREAIAEVLVIDEELRNILKYENTEKIKEKLKNDNFKSMLATGLDKVIDGVTSLDEVIRAVDI